MAKRREAFNMLQPVTYTFTYAAETHIGRRARNEDAVRIPSSENDLLFAIADGLGGHSGGDLASRLACQGLTRYDQDRTAEPSALHPESVSRRLVATVLRIDKLIRLHGRNDAALADMGTTLSCLVLAQGQSIIAHVGDSRIYRLRRGHLTCLTTDHTFVQDMIFEGQVDPERAASHPLRHLLTRSVGTPEPLEWVDTRIDDVFRGDRFLLSTDGLHTALSAERLAAVLGKPWNPQRVAARLVSEALQAGANDNISAIVIFVSESGSPASFAGHDPIGWNADEYAGKKTIGHRKCH